ncbi:unnamed protein product [Trichogramma brassicae]|uniref:Uncharacterized protein n=1 Tax=Trichogramma brassicae TaxID=86971 RepID=A0A6H5I7G9_9HYME|nr:unnamed protein product [Trichogramma brassicae]
MSFLIPHLEQRPVLSSLHNNNLTYEVYTLITRARVAALTRRARAMYRRPERCTRVMHNTRSGRQLTRYARRFIRNLNFESFVDDSFVGFVEFLDKRRSTFVYITIRTPPCTIVVTLIVAVITIVATVLRKSRCGALQFRFLLSNCGIILPISIAISLVQTGWLIENLNSLVYSSSNCTSENKRVAMLHPRALLLINDLRTCAQLARTASASAPRQIQTRGFACIIRRADASVLPFRCCRCGACSHPRTHIHI